MIVTLRKSSDSVTCLNLQKAIFKTKNKQYHKNGNLDFSINLPICLFLPEMIKCFQKQLQVNTPTVADSGKDTDRTNLTVLCQPLPAMYCTGTYEGCMYNKLSLIIFLLQ